MAAAKSVKKTTLQNSFQNIAPKALGNQRVSDHHYDDGPSEQSPVPAYPLEAALDALKYEIAGAHKELANLYATLEPFLPRNLFGDNDDAGMAEEADQFSELDSNLSPTMLEVHVALNQVLRLQQRLRFINSQVVR